MPILSTLTPADEAYKEVSEIIQLLSREFRFVETDDSAATTYIGREILSLNPGILHGDAAAAFEALLPATIAVCFDRPNEQQKFLRLFIGRDREIEVLETPGETLDSLGELIDRAAHCLGYE